MHSTVFGFALVFIAAVAGGGLAVPLKKRRKFELENIYIPSTVVMMLILPFVMAAFVLPNWPQAVHAAGSGAVWKGAAYGFGWGVGSIMFGYGVTMAGMSVGFATIMGINTAVGSLLPFLVKSRADLLTRAESSFCSASRGASPEWWSAAGGLSAGTAREHRRLSSGIRQPWWSAWHPVC